MKKKIDGLLFDLDGTLIDSRYDIAISANIVRNHFGHKELELEQVINYVGDGLPVLVQRILPNPTPEEIQEGIQVFREHYKDHCTCHTCLYPGVLETLKYFIHKPKAVVTNKPYTFTVKILEDLEIADFFSVVLGGDSLSLRKPNPLPLEHACQKLALDIEAVVMVGDSEIDIEAAQKANIVSCAVSYGFRKKEVLETLSPDFIIDHFWELKNIFK